MARGREPDGVNKAAINHSQEPSGDRGSDPSSSTHSQDRLTGWAQRAKRTGGEREGGRGGERACRLQYRDCGRRRGTRDVT